ncbi:RDD family protein [Streptomyces profundus]|uniref:RDD family protein n=1 Tax=Streptomyces profundus TaxID=2867410 RepID=UPI0022410396|nr:RDD family protein [Streptomyces sp. MA3_2.13]
MGSPGQPGGQQAPPGAGFPGQAGQQPGYGFPQPGQPGQQPGYGFPPASGAGAPGQPPAGPGFPPGGNGQPGQSGYGFPQPGGQPGQPGQPGQGQPGSGYGFPQQGPPAGQPGGYGYPPPAQGAPQGGYGYPPQQPSSQSSYLQSHEGAPLTMMGKLAEPEQKYPAPSGRRLTARLLDLILPLGGAIALAVPLLGDARDHISDRIDAIEHAGVNEQIWLIDGTTGGYLGMVLGVFFGVGLLFEVLPVALWGTTLGKAICGIQVLDMRSQEAPSFGSALWRWLVYNLLVVVLAGIVNMILAVRDRPWRQGWHDKAAKTFVATKKKPADPVGPAR